MAARLNKRHQEMVRQKIQASQLINRLTDHALGNLEKPLDATQVRAIEILLNKSLPNLTSMELSGELETKRRVISAEPLSDDEWSKRYGGDLAAAAGASESAH